MNSLLDCLDDTPKVVVDDPRTPEMKAADAEIDADEEFDKLDYESDGFIARPLPTPTDALWPDKLEVLALRYKNGEQLFSPFDRQHGLAVQGSYEPEEVPLLDEPDDDCDDED